jgi:hypothetical protein
MKVGAERATKTAKWWQKVPPYQLLWWYINHHISYIGCRNSCQDEKDVNAYGVYIFSGKGPTFSASCKTYEHYFKKG